MNLRDSGAIVVKSVSFLYKSACTDESTSSFEDLACRSCWNEKPLNMASP